AARPFRPDGGPEVGLLAGLVMHENRTDAEPVQIVGDEMDQIEVGEPTGGVEGDQAADKIERLGARRGHQLALPSGGLPIMARNSRRVRGSSRKAPSMRLVTMFTPVLCTPRVLMHSCAASITTATPRGFRTSCSVLAICAVSFSWICRRLA